MNERTLPLKFEKIMQSKTYTAFVLSHADKSFAIYASPEVSQNVQSLVSPANSPRPMTHEIVFGLLKNFEIEVIKAVLTDVQDSVFFARLFLKQQVGETTKIIEIDTRPSDCLTIALEHNAPVYCLPSVLEKVIPLEEPNTEY